MTDNIKIYKCFIGSPCDTEKERNACDRVFSEVNNTLGEHFNFRIESKKWEKDVYPDFGKDSQEVINQQIGNEYDIFVGIMWNRFGMPTERAESGTEEEFLLAYKRWEQNNDLNILFYFNVELINPNDLDIDQFLKVKEFKDKVKNLGGLYHEYNGVAEFEHDFKVHIQKVLLKKKDCSISEAVQDTIIEKIQLDNNKLIELFGSRLKMALRTYSSQPIFWVDPVLSKSNEILQNPDEEIDNTMLIPDIYKTRNSYIIKAPPQFGLTCLSHFIIKDAHEQLAIIGLYLDANTFKSNSIDKAIKKELDALNVSIECVSFIVLDSWNNTEVDFMRMLKKISDQYKKIPLIVMQSIDDTQFHGAKQDISIERDFEILHLLALPRNHVRKFVTAYNNTNQIGDEDVVLAKVVSDLDILNIHRTPINCITLLKVSEKYFDESPVNRTKMLEMVLFLLFNLDGIPTYKSKPDLKDCEYVLGRFCENMIKRDKYRFTRDEFIKDIKTFCKERLIELEIDLVFDVLYQNNIIIGRESEYVFRFSYWIFYFAAHRMHNNEEFANYIFTEKKYISFPEIIEFYTGIDRNREDALVILIKDIKEACDIVSEKVGLPDEMNPYRLMKWHPSDENINDFQKEVGDDVQQSKLPTELKDRYADRNYDPNKPYNQSVRTILNDYSLAVLMQKIKACSVALRNSDYVSPEIKRELLSEIIRSWEQLSKVLLALSPLLAKNGYAAFEGAGFILNGSWGNTFEERLIRIIKSSPTNVVGIFKDYLYSNKMGPLLFDNFIAESNPLRKHAIALFLVFERPNGWKSHIEEYISSIHKNSFYLYNIFIVLKSQYKYSFASYKELGEMKYLIKMGIAKHKLGIKRPGKEAIKKVSDNVIPFRKEE